MKIIFFDSNLFLQCMDLEQIPWGNINGSEDIILYIPREVQREIDKLKYQGSGRRNKRAKKANTLFKNILKTSDKELIINEKLPKVIIKFSPISNVKEEYFENLDRLLSDDRIIAEIIEYNEKHKSEDDDVFLLTHDTGPMVTANTFGLKYIEIPDDWLLPPESNTSEKRINELEKKIKLLESNTPEILVSVEYDNYNNGGELELEVINSKNLAETEIESLIDQAKSKYPLKENFDIKNQGKQVNPAISGKLHEVINNLYEYTPPTNEEIDDYKNNQYPEWVNKVRTFFTELPSKLITNKRSFNLTLSISNIGIVTAENVIIDIKIFSGLLFKNQDNNNSEPINLELPKPPRAPIGKRILKALSGTQRFFDGINSFNDLKNMINGRIISQPEFIPDLSALLNNQNTRDKNAFYYRDSSLKGLRDYISLECEEFRHQNEPAIIDLTIEIPEHVKIDRTNLQCKVSAKNLPKPIESNTPIYIKYSVLDTLSKAKAYII